MMTCLKEMESFNLKLSFCAFTFLVIQRTLNFKDFRGDDVLKLLRHKMYYII